MAALADPNSATALRQVASDTARAHLSSRPLPNGPCNHRDIVSGQCGCVQFWDKSSAELHDQQPNTAPSYFCFCGHHACFHLKGSRAVEPVAPAATVQPLLEDARHAGKAAVGTPTTHNAPLKASASAATEHVLQQSISSAPRPTYADQRESLSQASTSGLPGIPSICRLSYDQHPAPDTEAGHEVNQSRHTVTGLGLSMMQLGTFGTVNHQQSPAPAVASDASISRTLRQSFSETDLASTRANSVMTEPIRASPSRGILDQVLEFNRNLQLDVPGDTIPNTYNPEDFIQSATEVATPSAAATPDLDAADQTLQEGKHVIDNLVRLTSNIQDPKGSPQRPTSATSAPGSQRWLANSPVAPQEQLQNILRAASPQVLQKLFSYLAPLHNLLTSMPNVATTMRELSGRLDMLENGSFNYVQPDHFDHTLISYDDRIVSLEHRMDEHERNQQAIDNDHGSCSSNRQHIENVMTSFGSNHSLQSTTSSALILAAVDRKDTEMEIGNIKDRLEILEAAALPSSIQPWEVEVVLLPWGRELRGIWFSPNEPMHEASRTTTQDSEEWTQARSSLLATNAQSPQALLQAPISGTDSSPYPGPKSNPRASVFSDTESGWSSQAISEWASGSTEDWLFPKACGSNNMVYKRLESRGFIRNVTLTGASARDLQVTLSRAFSDLLEHLSYTEQDGDAVVDAYPGLRASFIPLRKVMKESKLHFLSPAEMASSALWSAQFLAAGVIMRVSGGKKRLYVTQREAYIQHTDDLGSSWTWQELRQLPRYQPGQDSQMEGNDEHCQPRVPEADAKEACWQFVQAYDAPPASVHSSFESHDSVQLSMRPADRQWRRSITPSSILKNRLNQPISPLSENHPPRPTRFRNRTASASIIEQLPAGSAKRRLNLSPAKQSSAPQSTSRTPSSTMARLKRRRTANPASSQHEEVALTGVHVTMGNATPRRSREPPSPFFSSVPALPRSNSDIMSRPSQRSVAMTNKSTPFAYATPHSGPFIGAPGFVEYNNGGDTEPDDDDNAAYEDDDGEPSWRGVTDGDDSNDSSSSSSSSSSSEEDEHHGASFSGEDSGFGTDSGEDDGQSDAPVEQNSSHSPPAREEDGDVFDTLLGVLEK